MTVFAIAPVLKEAAATANGGLIMGVMTAFFLLFFTGWVLWAWAPANREHMERASRMPLDDDEVR